MIGFFKILLRGMSQVMLQNNEITGALFLLGIFYNSPLMGLGALLGVLAGTAAAFLLHYERKNIEEGLYGFNGALVGIAVLFFFGLNPLAVLLAIFGAAASTLIMELMRKRIAPYTFPFVLTALLLLATVSSLKLAQIEKHELPASVSLDFIPSVSMGFGQVMLQANTVTGIVFLIAILVSSRISGVYALIGSVLGLALALVLSFPLNLINAGVFGFNGVLCGIAFAGRKGSALAYAVASIAISVLIAYGMTLINVPALTAPFVFATWIVSGLRKFATRK